MERFVKLTAPTGKVDFVLKLCIFLLICGGLNHMRDFVTYGPLERNTFRGNFIDALWTALPMCTFALVLIGHLNTLQKRLYVQATTDSLTQLRNRRWFMDRISILPPGRHALIMLDIDHFKRVNDTYGHAAGDNCLQVVASHVRAAVRDDDFCARIGGEEFAVLVTDATPAIMEQIATRLCQGVTFEPQVGMMHRVTISAGVAFVDRDTPLKSVLQLADAALYRSKSGGRAQFQVSPPGDWDRATVGPKDDSQNRSAIA